MEDILKHAKAAEPLEACGFLLSNGEYYPARNISSDPTTSVIWHPDDFIAAQDKSDLHALVHSHPNGPRVLSSADRYNQVRSGLRWMLVVDNEIYNFPCVPHLVGRKFEHGKQDCYTLSRDVYTLSGIEFPDFFRADDWWDHGENLYLEHLPTLGFYVIDDNPQLGDVIMISLGSDTANHSAIYLGDGKILHHCADRLSKVDLYGGYFQRHTHSIWRYKAWQSLDFMAIYNDLDASSSYT